MMQRAQIRPAPAYKPAPFNPDRDKARGGYSLSALEARIRDCDLQPLWRDRADLSVAYYDGKQLTELQKAQCVADGLEPRSTNLIGRVINGVLGQEARSRGDVKLEADSGEIADMVDVLNLAFKEAQRESYAAMAVSAAYGSQVKAGLGWVEVSRDRDPLNYPYRVVDVHRNEMWYDWRAKDFLLRDAWWLVRKQWHELDELVQSMPQHANILEMMANGWEGWGLGDWFDQYDHETLGEMTRAHDDYRRFRVRSNEWFDSARKRVKLYEVWYKVPAVGVSLKLSPTRRVLYDETNALHVEAVSRGIVKVEKVQTRQIRRALFAGPYRLSDEGTTRRNFPYVPFFAFRDDEDGSPYGLVEGMKSPQDEYNERRLRIQWLLKARQVTVDNDALDLEFNSWDDLANNVMRPDMLLVLNAARRNAQGVKVESNLQLQNEQVAVMQDAKQLIQDVPGVYSSQLGNAPAGVTSGIALSSLVEQGIVAMGELNDNYRNARRLVFENLLELVIEDHSDADLHVMLGEGTSRRVVVLNTLDKNGQPVNMVKDASVRVGLSDVPDSPAARLQNQQQLATIISSLKNNPQAVVALTPAYLELTNMDSETKRQVIEDLRKMSGLPPPGDRAARAQQAQQAEQQAAQQAQVAQAMQAATIKEAQAKAETEETQGVLNIAKADQIYAQIGQQARGEEEDDEVGRATDEAIAESVGGGR